MVHAVWCSPTVHCAAPSVPGKAAVHGVTSNTEATVVGEPGSATVLVLTVTYRLNKRQ
jgi:hypothetical protein